ncbi:tetratricopeptide repeat protein [Salmonella enterica subsp. enterica serovar Weltevreden]|nr:tetratricopeptide repeat protein [Salmonella enterica subsp. enterica serovar Weltevreden]
METGNNAIGSVECRYPFGPYSQRGLQLSGCFIYALLQKRRFAASASRHRSFLCVNRHALIMYNVMYMRGLTNMALDDSAGNTIAQRSRSACTRAARSMTF